MKRRIKEPVIGRINGDEIVFQRNLGHSEMPQANRWVETTPKNCMVCNKHSYCIFVWNKNLSKKQIDQQGVKKGGGGVGEGENFFWNYSEIDAIKTDKLQRQPVLSIGSNVYPMVPLTEFFERLQLNQAPKVRHCNNEIEKSRFQKLKLHI